MTSPENKAPALQILLAAYNSQLYLRAQLDSLLAQEEQNFQILIRDGGSGDDTGAIIREYQEKYPEKILFLGSGKAAPQENFTELLRSARAPLLMFCDHDDVWMPQKISATLAKYRELEKRYGSGTPILIFTDSCVTDKDLNVLDRSLLHYQNLDPEHLTLNRLILQNVPSGNTMLLNRALIDLASPVPPEAVMHDHWIALTAAAFGRIGYLAEPTLYYRQHAGNVYGASEYSASFFFKRLLDGRTAIRSRFEQNVQQAVAFGRRFDARLSAGDRAMLAALGNWQSQGFFRKRANLLRWGIRKTGFLRNLGVFFLA